MNQELTGILLVDDEAHFTRSASLALRMAGYMGVKSCNDSREAMGIIEEGDFSLVLLDITMPHITGRELLDKITSSHPHVVPVMITGLNDVGTAVDCMQGGAFDYVVKPVSQESLISVVKKALAHHNLRSESLRLRDRLLLGSDEKPGDAFGKILTNDPAMRKIFGYVDAVSLSELPVLLRGEFGTGKKLLAEAIHVASGRKGKFVSASLSGVEDFRLHSLLFGKSGEKGLVEKAANGTLFLDEVAGLDADIQGNLLQLVDHGRFQPDGDEKMRWSSARLVMATAKDLEKLVEEENFRKDLYYRLQSHQVALPPLRERPGDVGLLLVNFLREAAEQYGRKLPEEIPEDLLPLLQSHSFPGNVQEFRSVVFDALARCPGDEISTTIFRTVLEESESREGSTPKAPGRRVIFGEELPLMRDLEDQLILAAMEHSGGNKSLASRTIGLTRQTLINRLKSIEVETRTRPIPK